MSLSKIFSEAEKAQKEVTELASGLVKLNSAHPDGKTVECVEYIKKYFEEKGIEYYIHSKEENKPNIVGVLKGESNKKILWVVTSNGTMEFQAPGNKVQIKN